MPSAYVRWPGASAGRPGRSAFPTTRSDAPKGRCDAPTAASGGSTATSMQYRCPCLLSIWRDHRAVAGCDPCRDPCCCWCSCHLRRIPDPGFRRRLEIALQEIVEEGADHRDHGELAEVVPVRLD